MKSRNGFTLVELVITLAVASIVMGLCTPPLVSWLAQARLKNTMRTLHHDLNLAKSRAVRVSGSVAVDFTADGSYRVFEDNGACLEDGTGCGQMNNWVRDGNEQLLIRRELPGDVTIANASFAALGRRLRYGGSGRPAGLGGNVILARNTEQRKVILSMLGRMRVESSSDGGVTWH